MHVNEQAWLTDQFEEHRSHLQAVAYRMLGSASEAEDAVQESWLRLRRADTASVENLRGWLTTVVGRVSILWLVPPEVAHPASPPSSRLAQMPPHRRRDRKEFRIGFSVKQGMRIRTPYH